QSIELLLNEKFRERFIKDYPLSIYTSFRCGGNAKYLVYPEKIEEIIDLIKIINKFKTKFLILGKGTNVLVSDSGFEGIIISTLKMKKISIEDTIIKCECGTKISDLLKFCLKNSLKGLEFLSGIPGTIGGAVKNNAGLKDKWISEKIISVKYLDIMNLRIIKKQREQLFFDYRKSEFNENDFLWEIELNLQKGEEKELKEFIRKFIEEKKEKQPIMEYSAGSIFKNPYPFFAGELIEKCGLKGFHIGDCYISEKHANFIVNRGKGKAQDVYQLIKLIKQKVKEKYNIDLELEIQLIGDFR
ncbi:MAG: UDP-N-acetylmuramate dehydrogenase, partial [bacterium]|nr:UDP-N-acetylmuramate dehydrogenase [bacterium]MDW8164050.1 UDP-N-acetylmuramate dehydrogenase [Candidatus Omnitrophota bacterium]